MKACASSRLSVFKFANLDNTYACIVRCDKLSPEHLGATKTLVEDTFFKKCGRNAVIY
jgi:hypothetical protein